MSAFKTVFPSSTKVTDFQSANKASPWGVDAEGRLSAHPLGLSHTLPSTPRELPRDCPWGLRLETALQRGASHLIKHFF